MKHFSLFRLVPLAVLLAPAWPAAAQPASDTVAIVFDGPVGDQQKSNIHAFYVENLLGHFALHADIIALNDYKPGMLAKYRAGFFIGTDTKSELPAAFLKDVRGYQQPFCWLGQH